MSRATPWSLQSVHPDMQDAARDAALREGLSLRQWIERTIDAYAAERGLDPQDLDQDERDAAVSERLSQEAEPRRLFAVDATSRRAPAAGLGANKVDGMLKDLAARLRDNPRAPASTPTTPWTQAPAQGRASQPSALQDALQEALRVAQREVEPAPPRQQRPAARPAPRPAPLAPRDQAMAENAALRQQIDELARSVANMPRKSADERDATADERTLRKLAARTDEIRDLLSTVIARPTQTNRIERQLDILGARIDELAASAPTMAECNELSRGLGEIRSLLSSGRNPDLIEALDRKIDQLSRKLESMAGEPKDSLKFDDLARRIDNVHRRIEANISNPPKADTAVFERLIEELKRKLEQPAPKIEIPTLDFSAMESEIRRLSNKIDAASARPENPALEGLRRDIASLAARVDAISATVQSSSTLSTKANEASLEALRKDVQGLSARIDNIASTAPEVSVLDGLQSQMEILVDRIEALPKREATGVHALEAQIVKLADKIDSISGPSREETMLAQLQTEIGRLAKRLDAAPEESAGAAFAMLEQVQQHLSQLPVQQRAGRTQGHGIDHSVTDMVQQIQALREAAADVVETSERQAQKEAVAAKEPEPSLNEALQRELADLRAQQQNAEQRTTQVLNAVHETLNRLVGRLSELEEDISEVRPEPVLAAPAPAQTSAPPKPPAEPHAPMRQEPSLETPEPQPAPHVEVKPQVASARVPEPAPEPAQPRPRPGPAAVLSNQASFIAAARRAAHAAGDEPPPPQKPTPMMRLEGLIAEISARATEVRAEPVEAPASEVRAPRSSEAPSPKAKPAEASVEAKAPAAEPAKDGTLSAIRRVLSARRRPMLIALAGLIVILGSLQTLKLVRSGEAPVSLGEKAAPAATEPARMVAAAAKVEAPAEAPAAPAAAAPADTLASPESLPAPGFTPPLASNGFDSPAQPATAAPAQPVSLAEAAANGQANAQYEMGVRLAEGRGAQQDSQAALQWLDKAAKQNLAPAQYRLAAMLERGLGAPKDLKRAQEFYNKAAGQGHVRAMHNMGVLSAEGLEGKPDYAAAANWFRKAADFGLRDSQYNLAILYARGMGVEKNLPVSFAWFNAAAVQGDSDAAQKRDEIGARLTPTQMSAAKAMIDAFRPRTPDAAANEVAQPPGGWDAMTVSSVAPPKPAARTPAPKAKVSKLNQ